MTAHFACHEKDTQTQDIKRHMKDDTCSSNLGSAVECERWEADPRHVERILEDTEMKDCSVSSALGVNLQEEDGDGFVAPPRQPCISSQVWSFYHFLGASSNFHILPFLLFMSLTWRPCRQHAGTCALSAIRARMVDHIRAQCVHLH